MSYWLHRISNEFQVSQELLEKNLLSIGFSAFLEDDFNLLDSFYE